MDKTTIGYKFDELCATCGGKCCTIYLKGSEGGVMEKNITMEDWINAFHFNFGMHYGVEPLYDAQRVHLLLTKNPENVQYQIELKALKSQGIDINKCEFCSSTGCLVERELRPKTCVDFQCSIMRTLTSNILLPKDENLSFLYEKFNVPYLDKEMIYVDGLPYMPLNKSKMRPLKKLYETNDWLKRKIVMPSEEELAETCRKFNININHLYAVEDFLEPFIYWNGELTIFSLLNFQSSYLRDIGIRTIPGEKSLLSRGYFNYLKDLNINFKYFMLENLWDKLSKDEIDTIVMEIESKICNKKNP